MTRKAPGSTAGLPTALAEQLADDLEKAALQLAVDGFERWRQGQFVRFGDYEDHFTIRLVECMDEIRRERNMALMPVFQYVDPSDAMRQGEIDPAHAPRIDIVVASGIFNQDVYFSIECKRLRADGLTRNYVSRGINRFVSGYYGARQGAGGMIGYVLSDSPVALVRSINAHIDRAQQMGPPHRLIPGDAIGWLHMVFVSNHERLSPLKPIRLTHLLFDMRSLKL